MDMKADRYGYLRKSGAIAVSGSACGKGALGSASEEKKGLAKRANIEGNESAKYEKLEKRSLKSLKQGGSEKELRAGHNSFGDIAKAGASGGISSFFGGGDSGPSAAEKRLAKRVKNVKTVAKSGVAVDAATNPILAARVGRRRDVQAVKDAGGDVKAARQAGRADVKAAKTVRKDFTKPEAKASKKSFNSTIKSAKAVNKLSKGNRKAGLASIV